MLAATRSSSRERRCTVARDTRRKPRARSAVTRAPAPPLLRAAASPAPRAFPRGPRPPHLVRVRVPNAARPPPRGRRAFRRVPPRASNESRMRCAFHYCRSFVPRAGVGNNSAGADGAAAAWNARCRPAIGARARRGPCPIDARPRKSERRGRAHTWRRTLSAAGGARARANRKRRAARARAGSAACSAAPLFSAAAAL